jgi:hypothetical protein
MDHVADCTFVHLAVGYYYQADSMRVRDDFNGTSDVQLHHYWVVEFGR